MRRAADPLHRGAIPLPGSLGPGRWRMRLLIKHVEYVRWRVTRKVKGIGLRDRLDADLRENEVKDALLVFCAVEGVDQEDPATVIKKACYEIEKMADRVKADNVVIFPYVHLFPESLAPATFAHRALVELQGRLSERFNVLRAPFGWYKVHEYRCIGHPLAESSRTVRPG